MQAPERDRRPTDLGCAAKQKPSAEGDAMGKGGLHQNKGGRREKGHVRYKKKSLLLFMLNLVKTRLKKKQKVEHSQHNLNPTKLKKAGDNKNIYSAGH